MSTTDSSSGEPPLDEAAERFLLALLDEPAPSGFEEPVAELWRERARELGADVTTDRIGTSFASVGVGRGPRIAVIGHLDEIGLIITKIDSKGFCRVTSIGGWDPVVLPGQRLRILGTPQGLVRGSVSRTAVHVLDQAARGKAPKVDDLWVDIGAGSAEEARALVRVGDPAVIDVTPHRIGGGDSFRLMSRSVDNRVGAFIALEVVRLAAERGVAAEVVAVGSVGEEIGMGGATVAAAALRPDRVCVVDVTTPGDTPGGSDIGDLSLGKGPIISRGSTLSERVVGELVEATVAAELPYQLRAKGIRTATDADQTIKASRGMAACLVSVPARYLHTPVEQVDLRDVRSSIDVIAAWVEHVAAGWSSQ